MSCAEIIFGTLITILALIITLHCENIHYLFDLKFSLADIFIGFFIILEIALFGCISGLASTLIALFLTYKKFEIHSIFDYLKLFVLSICCMIFATLTLIFPNVNNFYSMITDPLLMLNMLLHGLTAVIIGKLVLPKA